MGAHHVSITLLAVISGLCFAYGQLFANLNSAVQLTTDVKTLTQDGQAVTVSNASSLPSSSLALSCLLYRSIRNMQLIFEVFLESKSVACI